jgi:hypothetical protein
MDAKFTIELSNQYLKDTEASAKMAAVSITDVLQERVEMFTLCSDITTVPVAGTIRREIIVTLTADLVSQFPTNQDQLSALRGTFLNVFRLRLPAVVNESLIVAGGLCP